MRLEVQLLSHRFSGILLGAGYRLVPPFEATFRSKTDDYKPSFTGTSRSSRPSRAGMLSSACLSRAAVNIMQVGLLSLGREGPEHGVALQGVD